MLRIVLLRTEVMIIAVTPTVAMLRAPVIRRRRLGSLSIGMSSSGTLDTAVSWLAFWRHGGKVCMHIAANWTIFCAWSLRALWETLGSHVEYQKQGSPVWGGMQKKIPDSDVAAF